MTVDGDDELAALKLAAFHAYERVRLEVIDRFPVGARIDEDELSPSQLDAMRALYAADEELADYRERHRRGDDPD